MNTYFLLLPVIVYLGVLPWFCRNCQYKDNLPLSSRLAIAQTYVRFDGYHGLVTELATNF